MIMTKSIKDIRDKKEILKKKLFLVLQIFLNINFLISVFMRYLISSYFCNLSDSIDLEF